MDILVWALTFQVSQGLVLENPTVD